jgi:hypothetical protein
LSILENNFSTRRECRRLGNHDLATASINRIQRSNPQVNNPADNNNPKAISKVMLS